MKKHYCPACESKLTSEFAIDLKICEKCSHIFKDSTVPESYYKNYVNQAHKSKNKKAIANAQANGYYRWNFMKSFGKAGQFLEVGSGSCHLLSFMSEDFECESVELSEKFCKDMEGKFEVYNSTPSNAIGLKTYDAIGMFNVLERMNDPIKELQTLYNHMQDDGLMFLELPMLVFETLEFDPRQMYDGLRTQYFNQVSLNILLKKCGLKIIQQINFWASKTQTSTLLCVAKESLDVTKYTEIILNHIGEQEE